MACPLVFTLLHVVLLGLVTACGGTTTTAPATGYTTIAPGDAVPTPTGPVVLSLRGAIGTTNAGNQLDFDLATLERLGLVEFTVNDPHLQARTTYRGILIERLLAVARVPATATTIQAIALNDYKVPVPISIMRQWPVMLATFRNGDRMPVADKGPLEIVFPYDSFPIDPAVHDPMWAWQLRTMEIE